MIPARLGDDAVPDLVVGQREDGVARAADLEGAGFLQIFTFEEDLSADHRIEGCGGHDGRAVDAWSDPGMRRLNRFPAYGLCVGFRFHFCSDGAAHGYLM